MVAKKKAKTKRKINGQHEQQAHTLESLLSDTGFEGATAGSYAMPFLRILQKGSPEVDKDDCSIVCYHF